MSRNRQPADVCRCENCCKEIPRSTAMTPEGSDYKWNFCDSHCYDQWKIENRKYSSDPKSDKDDVL